MNSKQKYVVLLLLTAVAVILVAFISKDLIVSLLVGGITVAWVLVEKRSRDQADEYILLINRIDKLKTFSCDLQRLIESELALVQDDVLRTRNIVSDSTDILQAASLSIHATITSQQSEINTMAIGHVQASQKNQANSQVSLPQVDGSFTGDIGVTKLNENNTLMRLSADKMLQALQFEDIVNQVSERVAHHIGDIQQTVNILSSLCNSELSISFDSDLRNMQQDYLSVKEKLNKISAKKIAAQEDMSEGDIDLF